MKNRLLYLFLSAISRLPLGMLQRLGAIIGWLLWILQTRMAQVSRENIGLCFPQLDGRARRQLAKSSLEETGKTICETAFAWMAPTDRCRSALVIVSGTDYVDAALAAKRGLIFIIPHLGNWEMINHYLGPRYGLTHMYQPNRSRSLEHFMHSRRRQAGTIFVTNANGGIRTQLATLCSGGTIGAMPDQEPEVHTGTFARFFGINALTNQLVPNLARRTGSAAVVATCLRLPMGEGFKIAFHPVELTQLDEQEAMQALNDIIEAVVRRAPDQYLWSYKRFRTRPEGEPELYQFAGHPTRSAIEKFLMAALLKCQARLPLSLLRGSGAAVGEALRLARGKYASATATNLSLCFSQWSNSRQREVKGSSLREFGKTFVETGKIWYSSPGAFTRLCSSVEGLEHLRRDPKNTVGTIVLTPPIGNREVIMRFLGERFRVAEYYHPNTTTSLDDLIRRQRNAMGIALLSHTLTGRARLVCRLKSGGIVTLCPDQQPRLRGGEFIPFFGCPGLTTTALPSMLRESCANLVFGIAIREKKGFSIRFHRCDHGPSSRSGAEILSVINKALEGIVEADIDQYRWSDKRFNIRPPGEPKVYRK